MVKRILSVSTYSAAAAFRKYVLRQPSHYHQVASRSWTVHEAETCITRPAIFLDGELERILQAQVDTQLDVEIARVSGTQVTHAPTVAYELKDVTLYGGSLYLGAMRHRLQVHDRELAFGPVPERGAAVMASTLYGSKYFGHWLHDDVVLRVLASELGDVVEIPPKGYWHEAGYRQILGMPSRVQQRARFSSLTLIDDWGQNGDRRRRHLDIHHRITRNVQGRGNRRVYIQRGPASPASGRNLLNTDAMEALLSRLGFVVVDPGTMSAKEMAEHCLGASLVLGLEGSHLVHALYAMALDGTMLCIQPPDRFCNNYKDLTDALGQRYGFTVGTPGPGGFDVDLDRLQRLIDLAGQP